MKNPGLMIEVREKGIVTGYLTSEQFRKGVGLSKNHFIQEGILKYNSETEDTQVSQVWIDK